MTPQPKLSTTGYCLANAGKAAFTIQTEPGTYQYEWIKADNNETGPRGKIESAGKEQEFKAPFDTTALLYLSRTN